MSDVFVSYAREDKGFVQRLCEALKAKNREAWVDWEGILPSAQWRQEILGAIEAADAVVWIVSEHSAASNVCRDELAHAVSNNKRVVPLVLEDVNESALPEAIKERNWIFFRQSDDFSAGLQNLITALDTDIEWVRFHTRLLTRATEWQKQKGDSSYTLRGTDLRKAELALKDAGAFEPRLLPLQVDYILASRKAANRRMSFAIGASAAAAIAVVILGSLFVLKRQESALNLAAHFRELGLSEMANNNPLAAEAFFARALSITDNISAREGLLQARAKSPLLLWINAPSEGDSLLLSVSADGVLVALGSPRKIAIWNTFDRKRVRVFSARLNAEERPVAAFSVSHRLFALGVANKVQVWDLQSASEQPIKTIATHSGVSALAISTDDEFIMVGQEDGIISSWGIRLGEEAPYASFRGHSDRITAIAVSSNNQTLVSGSWDETAKTWNLGTQRDITTFTGHDDALLCVAISPDGETVASAGWDDTIWIWERTTGRRLRALTGHSGSILALAFSPDGKWLLSGSEDGTARLWDVQRGKHVLTFPGHSTDVSSVAFLNNDRTLTADTTGVVRLWDIGAIGERQELTTLRGHGGAVTMISFDPIASLAVSSSIDKTVDLWSLKTGQLLRQFGDLTSNVSSVAFSPDGKFVAVATKTSEIEVLDIASGAKRELKDTDATEKIRHVIYSRDGSQLVGGSEDGRIRIWSIADGRIIKEFAAHTAKIQGLEFSPDGTLLASSSEDSTIKLWDAADWHLRTTLIGHQSGVYETAFSPDGKVLLSGSDDKTARLWEITSGKELTKPITHESPVWAVGFDADGRMIATGSEDSTLQLWKVSGSGVAINLHEHFVVRMTDGPIWWLKFHRDAASVELGIASQDRTVRILRLDRVEKLLSAANELEREAEERGGLKITQQPNGEPRLAPIR